MAFDLIRRVETLGHPRILVVGDLILDRYIWGDAERISQEAPVPLLRADHREHRLGGAASVATMLRALGAQVCLMGVVGRDAEAGLVRRLLADRGIDDRLVLDLDDRPTTLKERYIGRAQDRHPQQMIRVDYETRDPIPRAIEAALEASIPEAVKNSDIVLISDYDKGVCTPTLLRRLIAACRSLGVRVIADPIRSSNYSKYHWVHCMTPNRLEAQLATGMTIASPEDAFEVGRRLVETLDMEAVLVTLDRDGMALVRADGRAEIVPTRPRQVYDITGAGDMVLSVVGLCLASRRRLRRGGRARKRRRGPRGREDRGRPALPRGDPARPDRSPSRRGRQAARARVDRGRCPQAATGRAEGRLHQRLLRPAPRRPRPLAQRGGRAGRLPRRRDQFRRERPPAERSERPINPEDARAELLAALECVDAVVVFDEDTPLALIEAIQPDVLVKGGDYRPDEVVGREEVEAAGGTLVLIPLVQGHSTTRILHRVADRTVVSHPPEKTPPSPAIRPSGVVHPASS